MVVNVGDDSSFGGGVWRALDFFKAQQGVPDEVHQESGSLPFFVKIGEIIKVYNV